MGSYMRNKHLEQKAWFDGAVEMQRYDVVRHPQIEKWNELGLSYFWRPEEVDISKDKFDFMLLSPCEQRIFTLNLRRQIVLDSVQGREPFAAFLPLASSPENENAIANWGFQETIHSRSYTHIIRNVYNDPSVIFDDIMSIEQIKDLLVDLDKYYDPLIQFNHTKELLESPLTADSVKEALSAQYSIYEHKKAFWRCLMAVNALEAIRFYVSFVCSWAFMEMKEVMEGNAKIIKLIARDEANHLIFTQRHLNKFTQEDPDFVQIKKELELESTMIFLEAAEQEKKWAEYLFAEGEMLGLNCNILCSYVDWITDKRMSAVGLSYPFDVPEKNPLPWVEHWVSGNSKQVALQEAENDSYLLGVLSGSVRDNVAELKQSLYRYL